MLPTTLRGEPVLLCPYLANWAGERPSLTLSVDAAVTRSLGGREARLAHAATLRARLACALFLRAGESAAFRAALRALAEPRALNAALLTVGIDFTDTAPPAFAPRAGAAPPVRTDGAGLPLFPLPANWADGAPAAGGVSYDIGREQIGHDRAPATTYYPQLPARPLRATFTAFDDAQLAALVSLFQDRCGPLRPFVFNHPHDGPLLGRFAADNIKLDFHHGRSAGATLTLLELPHEALETPPPGETPGLTLGPLPRRAQLFVLAHGEGAARRTARVTAHEHDLLAGGHLWQARPVEHGAITESLTPERSKVRLTARLWDGSPFALLSPPRLETPLEVELLSCAVADDGTVASAPVSRFKGRVAKAGFDGPIIQCDVAHLLARLQENVPDYLVQPDCNHEFFSTPWCGVPRLEWTFTATIDGYTGGVLHLSALARAGGQPVPALPANFFAHGRLLVVEPSGTRSRAIAASTTPAAGSLQLTPVQPLDDLAATAVTLEPACDGSRAACAFYGASPRHGGFPHTPAANPTITPVETDENTGKK